MDIIIIISWLCYDLSQAVSPQVELLEANASANGQRSRLIIFGA